MSFDLDRDDQIRKNYETRRKEFEDFKLASEDVLRRSLQRNGLSVLTVDSRVKTCDSLIEKCRRKSYSDPFAEATDIIGLRIVCMYREDIELIDRAIREVFIVDEGRSARHDQPTDPRMFGYASRHFVVSMRPAAELADDIALSPKAEIQVRTIVQHAWASVEHNLQYKRELEKPEEVRRRFARIAAMLDLVDDEFSALRTETSAAIQKIAESTASEVEVETEVTDQYKERPKSRVLEEYIRSAGLQDALTLRDLFRESGARRPVTKEYIRDIIDAQRGAIDQNAVSLQSAHAELERLQAELQRLRNGPEPGMDALNDIAARAQEQQVRISSAMQEVNSAGAKIGVLNRLLQFLSGQKKSTLQ